MFLCEFCETCKSIFIQNTSGRLKIWTLKFGQKLLSFRRKKMSHFIQSQAFTILDGRILIFSTFY